MLIKPGHLRLITVLAGLTLALVPGSLSALAQDGRLDFRLQTVETATFDATLAGEPAEDEDVLAPMDLEELSPAWDPGDTALLTGTSLFELPETDTLPRRFDELFVEFEPSPLVTAAGLGADQAIVSLPIVYDIKVERHIRFFNTAIRDRFETWLTRLSHYRPMVERIFSEFDLPSDLVFLSLVESGFNPNAYSRARATGPWQFMKGTARLYGLRVDAYVDERRDPIKSTVAAARYLRDLYDLFGTWPLAMAAYNAGEGKVQRALNKTRGESFWEIAPSRYLRRETREYVPRFMAAAIIAKNPTRYGFSLDETEPHQFEEVVVDRAIHLRDLAAATGLSFVELRRLNPELRKSVTPPSAASYHLKVPIGTKVQVEEALDRVKTWTPPAERPKRSRRWARGRANDGEDSSGWYRVRGGDSLWTIAKRFHLSVSELKELNNLTGRRPIIRPGDLLSIAP